MAVCRIPAGHVRRTLRCGTHGTMMRAINGTRRKVAGEPLNTLRALTLKALLLKMGISRQQFAKARGADVILWQLPLGSQLALRLVCGSNRAIHGSQSARTLLTA